MKKRRKSSIIPVCAAVLGLLSLLTIGLICFPYFAHLKSDITDKTKPHKSRVAQTPEELLTEYIRLLNRHEYKKMYSLLQDDSKNAITEADFILRNQNIYEGIEARNIHAEITGTTAEEPSDVNVSYKISFDSVAGSIQFENLARFTRTDTAGYALEWDDSQIFPELTSEDKVKVFVKKAKRGEIFDRNGILLAGEGVASSIGLVPGKMSEEPANDIKKMAKLLKLSPEDINKRRKASWVRDDSLVPVKTIRKYEEADLLAQAPDSGALETEKLKKALLKIPGVMISDVKVRYYPLGEKASHLTGYVQSITAEDLKKHPNEGYTSSSVIGRTGLESLYEKELKGQNGYDIVITDSEGNTKSTLASSPQENGKDIYITIDSALQAKLYDQFKEDKSCSVAMNPLTGEVLALVSTPSFDSNDFILGISNDKWNQLNKDKAKPLYNRFRQVWCPGSSFKPVIAAIGLTAGAIDPEEDFGNVGLRWQKDSSWGNYFVTTLHSYNNVNLENALIHSDNIYFAKAALKIGAPKLEEGLSQLGFSETLPFDITMSSSQYSNTKTIDTEIQLADTGYGQGQVLVNPLHLACLYSAFLNQGNILKPCLLYQEKPKTEMWLPDAFSRETAERIKNALIKTVDNSAGTAHAAHRKDIVLGAKTGTAEIKLSKSDTTGTELGWLAVFTADSQAEKPLLLISMAEDVKLRGGSSYVIKKVNPVLDSYLSDLP
ncbi:penicillin-binding protein [Anaerocolumna jejuensis DSM 15929]|uniref:Penicillin-binding protein n=1 Tax=Anaerocolumna jejuensis DSM 15929 TaxID=1121322 RepID=A0A1M6QSX0_9FIRM|nr:penicillin-binding transpeptidase domain-containing protein [Anaerocolumna jejuensis]SHK23351.1 penicillin-binding protein [Anaerocolumna jejuensis DSM 15929]